MSGSRKIKVLMIERHQSDGVSIGRVFDRVRRSIDTSRFEIETQSVSFPGGSLGVLLNLFCFSPRKADVYHVTGDINYISLLLPRDRTVLTIHDLITIRRHTGLRNWLLKLIYIELPARWVRYLTTISNATSRELSQFFDGRKSDSFDRAKIEVIENPLLIEPIAGFTSTSIDGVPTILHIGTAPNKNLDRLVDAIADSGYKLRVIGKLTPYMIADIRSRGILLGTVDKVDDQGMIDEYLACDIVAFCSTYEGFGLPIIEAQALGKPVITSDIEPMSLVAGDGALVVDPNDATAIRSAIDSLIADRELRTDLAKRGLENIKRFDPAKITECYQELYARVAANSGDDVI